MIRGFRHLLEEHKRAPQILATVGDLLRNKRPLLQSGSAVESQLINLWTARCQLLLGAACSRPK